MSIFVGSIICKKVQFQFLVRLMLLGIEDPQEPAVWFSLKKVTRQFLWCQSFAKSLHLEPFCFRLIYFVAEAQRSKRNINCGSVVRETNGLKIYCVVCKNDPCRRVAFKGNLKV